MSTDYFSDYDIRGEDHSLPTPTDTPYQTPIPASRRTSRYGTPLNRQSESPERLPPNPDEPISPLDPRRFTPTLHAHLVEQILAKTRDVETKHKFIEDLEATLHESKAENESLSKELAERTKESRVLKEELKHLEHGTLGALDTLAKERDDFRQANDDLSAKLDTVQKRAKTQEEDAKRVHDEWAEEKNQWAGEKRNLDLRIHAMEARLKIVLDEYAVLQQQQDQTLESADEGEGLDSGLGNDSDAGSIQSRPTSRDGIVSRVSKHSRNISNGSHRSIGRPYRFSAASTRGHEGHVKPHGLSLADELQFDEEEEELQGLELDSDDFPENEMRARRVLESRQSVDQDDKARRILGLAHEAKLPRADSTDFEPKASLDSGKTFIEIKYEGDARKHVVHTAESLSHNHDETPHGISPPRNVQYVDTGIQYSPPPSPVSTTKSPLSERSERGNGLVKNLAEMYEVEANQRRKRVSMVGLATGPRTATPERTGTPDRLKDVMTPPMVSAAVQTIDQEPISPPATPKTESLNELMSPVPPTEVDMCSTSTQTDPVDIAPPAIKAQPQLKLSISPPAPISIPSIVISPTLSAPSSPRQAVLPQHTKNAECQTSFAASGSTSDASVQTEAIRSAVRLAKLPPHLLPSAINSNFELRTSEENSRAASQSRRGAVSRIEGSVARNSRMLTELKSAQDNDSMTPRTTKDEFLPPMRSSSLIGGFSGAMSDDEDEREGDFSDDEHEQSAYTIRALKNKRPFGSPPTPVQEEVEPTPRPTSDVSLKRTPGDLVRRDSLEKPARVGKPQHQTSVRRKTSIRRSAMIHNGTTAQRRRSPSPDLDDDTAYELHQYMSKPPFPVPTRSSSRRIGFSKSEGSTSPTRRPAAPGHGRMGGMKKHTRQDSLRKVRSAALVAKGSRRRSRSPPPPSPSVDSTRFPPSLLADDMYAHSMHAPTFAIPGTAFGHTQQRSVNTLQTSTGSIGSSTHSVSVVDAIASTMVGEWMYKYVRKRKSFGVPEAPLDGSHDANGVRHRRWVWLSPYERSVMWSSKQPTTGTALLGKTGRKLIIQSVLDVADSSTPPKGAEQSIFNRSILILTPARALKFTAPSKERHYVWLTALSFLAHSGHAAPDVEAMPPPIPTRDPPQIPAEVITGSFRRSPVNDSIRLSKDRGQAVRARNMARQTEPFQEYQPAFLDRPIPDSAMPPNVPRHAHSRQRSSTGPGVANPLVYRNLSNSNSGLPSPHSVGSSDYYNYPPSVPSSIYSPPSVATSARQSEVSSTARSNFFEAMGTVRMEAFVADSTRLADQTSQKAGSLGRGSHVPSSARPSRRGSQWSASASEHPPGSIQNPYEVGDVFRGF